MEQCKTLRFCAHELIEATAWEQAAAHQNEDAQFRQVLLVAQLLPVADAFLLQQQHVDWHRHRSGSRMFASMLQSRYHATKSWPSNECQWIILDACKADNKCSYVPICAPPA